MLRSGLLALPLTLVGLALDTSAARSAAPDASWLPADTVSCIVVSDLNRFINEGKKSVIGNLLHSDGLKPFLQAVWSTQEKDPFAIPSLVGCTLDELQEATRGSLVLAAVGGRKRAPALVLLLDTQGRREQGQKLLQRLGRRLEKNGAEKLAAPEAEGVVVYNVPDAYALGQAHQLVCTNQESYLIVSTRLDALQDILARRAGQDSGLAENPNYRATTARSLNETPGALLSWYFEPLPYMSLWRILSQEKILGRDWLKILTKEGFGSLKGVGGACHIDPSTGQMLIRGHVHAPKPYPRTMAMLSCTLQRVNEPPSWVPGNAAVFGTLCLDHLVAFEAFGSLFDTLYGEGEEGVFNDVLKDIKNDPVGPKVDIRKELLHRVRMPICYLEMPSAASGPEKWLTALAVEQARNVANAVDRLFKGDNSAHRLDFGEHGLWQVLPEEISQNGDAARGGKDKKTDWSLPASAVGVYKQQLLFASSPELVRQVFSHEKPLSREGDYRRINAALDHLAGQTASVRMFLRVGLFQGRMLAELRTGAPKTKTFLATLMRQMAQSGTKRPGKGIDFTKLPSPEEVVPLLGGQGGISANLTGDTWSFVVLLTR